MSFFFFFCCFIFFFNDTATTEIYTLSLHDALPIAHRVGKPTPDFVQCMEDMLAGAEGVLTEIRARAVRLTWPPSPQRDAIGLPGRGVCDRVVGPDLLRVEGCEPHFLGAGALLALRESLGDQRPVAPAFDRLAFGWCVRQAQRELLFEDQRERRADVFARRVTSVAAPFEAVARRRTQGKRYGGGVNGEAKPILIEFDLGGDIDVVLATRGNEVIALGTQELRGPNESEARKRVEQRQLGAWLGQHEISKIMWLSTQLEG